MKFLHIKSGFTLVELVITAVITLFVVAGAVGIYLISYTSWREATIQTSLHRPGNIAMERMVRGVRGPGETRKNGLREARSIIIPALSEIRFTSGIDGRQRRFYLDDNNRLLYDPDISLSGDEVTLVEDINNLTFEQISTRRVRITLSLQERIRSKIIDVTLKTDVTLRN